MNIDKALRLARLSLLALGLAAAPAAFAQPGDDEPLPDASDQADALDDPDDLDDFEGELVPTTWTVNGTDIPLAQFIAQISEITGKTIVLDPRARQSQTVSVMSNVELDEKGIYALFLTVLKVHGLAATESEGVISIVQQVAGKQSPGPIEREEEHAPDMLITQVVTLSHIQSSEALKLLRPLIPQSGHIASTEKPNILIIADYASNMDRLLSLIAQIDRLDKDEIVMRPLEHAWVGTVAQVLEEIAPDELGRGSTGPRRVQIVANERNNSLVLKGKTSPIAEVLRLIDILDVQEIHTSAADVYTLNHADAPRVAEILNNLAQQSGDGTAPTANIQADEALNALIIQADPTTRNQLLSTVTQLDVRRLQVLIEAAIVEVSVNNIDSLGIEFAGADAGNDSSPLFTTTLGGIVGNLLARVQPASGNGDGDGTTQSRDAFDPVAAIGAAVSPTLAVARLDPDGVSFGAIVQALASDTRANLLSTPSVLTLDNEEAEVQAGEKIPFRTGSFTTTSDGANNPFQTIERENVGITLKVTPHIHEDDSIRMEVSLQAGNVVDAAVGAAGYADVVTNERNLESTILAEDRQIIVLGGLIQDDYRDSSQKVPLLGDIPLIGRAFRSERETLVKRHLLMFLKPTIFRTGDDAALAARKRYEGIYSVQGNPDAKVPPPELDDVFESREMP